MNLKALYSGILILCFYVVSAFSQNAGEITGTIIDGESGEPLRRASVLVVGTKSGGYSDVKGEFKIKKIPEGKYIVKISFVGYQSKEIKDIVVTNGKTNNITRVLLSVEKKLTDEIYVDSRRINDNEAAILALRKNAAQVSDGISRQEMSRLPDSDAGQSLKRVSGVTLVDNKFVYVRGVSERYSNTTLNGASLSSTEPDKKAFAFDMFPSEFLQNVNIAKSFTPDLPGNFAGGLVQMNTIDFPEKYSFNFTYSNTINTNTSLKSNQFLQTTGGSTDWFGMDDGTRKLPDVVPSSRRELDALRVAATSNNNEQTASKEKYQNMIQSFNSGTLKQSPTTLGAFANSGIGINFSNLFHIFENEFGLLASVNYGNSGSINDLERNLLLTDGSPWIGTSGTKSVNSINLGGLVNMAYKLGNSSSISLRNVYNRSADEESASMKGQDQIQQIDFRKSSTRFIEKELYSVQLEGEHTIEFKNLLVNWNLGYSASNRYEPDYRKFRYDRSFDAVAMDPNTPYSASISQTEQGDGAKFGRYFSNMDDNSYSGKLDLTIPIEAGIKLKFGTLSEFKDRDFSARSFTIILPRYGNELAPEIEALMSDYENPQLLLAPENFRVDDGLRISEETKASDSYKANEELLSGYLMLDVPFKLIGQNLRFIGGVRYEDSKQMMNSFDDNDAPLNKIHSYQDVLPSINLMWRLNENSNIRTSATQTLSRPSLREIAPFAFYDFENSILVTGNPNLKRALIQNYDLRYEYFPNPGEVISFSGFYKNFENAIEETITAQQSEPGKSFANAEGDAINYGIELEFRKSLNFITESLRNFALNINFSYVTSEITVKQGNAVDTRAMWGQSPYTLNLSVFYLNPESQTSVNIAYNTFGKRIIQVGSVGTFDFANPHVYELPRDIIDLSISQPVLDNKFDLKLVVNDLLNQNILWQQGGFTYASTLRGTSIGFSLGYRIN